MFINETIHETRRVGQTLLVEAIHSPWILFVLDEQIRNQNKFILILIFIKIKQPWFIFAC